MITEDYCSFETAKLLKEKGFDEFCRAVYVIRDERLVHCTRHNIFDFTNNERIKEVGDGDTAILAPTLQMTMKWLREVHNIHIEINLTFSENPEAHPARYYVYVLDTKSGNSLIEKSATISGLNPLADESGTPRDFNTYEEACEEAIKYTLKNLI